MANIYLSDQQRKLFEKYLAGKCTPEECEQVELWYQSFESAELPEATLEEASLQAVKEKLHTTLKRRATHARLLNISHTVLRIAAVFLFFAGLGTIGYLLFQSRSNQGIVYTVPYGQHKSIRLSDGSLVALNGGSSLELSASFNSTTRDVHLTGEAYFMVAKDNNRPFVISSGMVRTRVLGTSFNIQAYANEENIAVTVTEGKVRVDKQIDGNSFAVLSTSLLPGQQLVYTKANGIGATTTVDAEHTGAWRTGTVYFQNESIPEIARKLERKYGLTIHVTGPVVPDCRYTLRFSDESFAEALKVLAQVSGIQYRFDRENHLTINTIACK